MSNFIEERLQVLVAANTQFESHRKQLSQAARAIGSALRTVWQVASDDCVVGTGSNESFREDELEDPDENQSITISMKVRFEVDHDHVWTFFVPIRLWRSRHGIFAAVGILGNEHLIHPSSTGGYNLGHVIHDVETVLAMWTDDLAAQQTFKA